MNKLDQDLACTDIMIKNDNKIKSYDAIYFKSNEKLYNLFDRIDFKRKKVLSVMGSGDQMLHAYDRGALSVDLYDINNLSRYYLYLRVWNIEYFDTYYLPYCFSKNDISSILERVHPRTVEEKEAYVYWINIISRYSDSEISNLFFKGSPSGFDNNIDDLSKIREKVSVYNINFFNEDISASVCRINGGYDIIITSNISEYFRENEKQLTNYRDNLFSLLNVNGMIVSSTFMHDSVSDEELTLFKEYFDFFYLPEFYIKGYSESPGYIYKMKNRGV